MTVHVCNSVVQITYCSKKCSKKRQNIEKAREDNLVAFLPVDIEVYIVYYWWEYETQVKNELD